MAGPVLAQSPATPPIDTRCKPANQRTGGRMSHLGAAAATPVLRHVPVLAFGHLSLPQCCRSSGHTVEHSRRISREGVAVYSRVSWMASFRGRSGRRGRPIAGDARSRVRGAVHGGCVSSWPNCQCPTDPARKPGTCWGEQCAETPAGVFRAKVGESLVLPGDTPMTLHIVGTVMRRSLVLILHDAVQRPSSPVTDWKPSGRASASDGLELLQRGSRCRTTG